jgi:hypothetical protein
MPKQRMLLCANFNLTVRYTREAQNHIADTLSRAYLKTVAPRSSTMFGCPGNKSCSWVWKTWVLKSEIANGTGPNVRDPEGYWRRFSARVSEDLHRKWMHRSKWVKLVTGAAVPSISWWVITDDGFVQVDRIVIPAALRKSVIETVHHPLELKIVYVEPRICVLVEYEPSHVITLVNVIFVASFERSSRKEPSMSHDSQNEPGVQWALICFDF